MMQEAKTQFYFTEINQCLEHTAWGGCKYLLDRCMKMLGMEVYGSYAGRRGQFQLPSRLTWWAEGPVCTVRTCCYVLLVLNSLKLEH